MATTRIPPDFKEFLKLLQAHEVRFLFGARQNRTRVPAANRDLGFGNALPDVFDEANAMPRIAVLRSLSGVSFDGCWGRRIVACPEALED